ncbi:PREDICTED: pre-miRNA 5'-monophosphate methyltransferase [Ficedula albicollis]|uniref:pre-miRNA 5'-monophosphate methyltransferase n=1 Tax=Ficedula albicollis TaxID=59894 RepID=UPI0007AD7EDD|nr:PREDICTED: pre-miRNA 5'-monophosphate methyltransferase [Ficedula albicollis]
MAAPVSRGPEPGAAPYGNFPNYSRFPPPHGQISLWTPQLWGGVPESLLLLQELSVALYQHLLGLQEGDPGSEAQGAGKELKLLCCDIDPELIRRAQQSSPFPSSISFASLDIMDPGAREPLLSSFLQRFGRSPRCYRAAARRLRRLGRRDFQHFRSLGIRGDMAQSVTRILTQQCAMELVCCFGNTAWDRSLLLFRAAGAAPEQQHGPGAEAGEGQLGIPESQSEPGLDLLGESEARKDSE